MFLEEYVYYSIQGDLQEPHPEVANLFEEDAPCERWYAEVLAAYQRICNRLGEENEDDDVELILTNMNRIQHEIAIQMFRYGAFFADRLYL